MSRVLFFIAAVFAAAVLLCPAWAKESNAPWEHGEGQWMESFAVSGYADDGQKKWDLRGATAQILDEVVELQEVVATSYGRISVTLTSEEGTLDQNQEDIQVRRNVVVTTSDGAQIFTELLNWQSAGEIASTPERVRMVREQVEIEGTGAKALPQEKYVELHKDVEVRAEPSTVITCMGAMEVRYGEENAVFNDNVHVQDDRGTMSSDILRVWFDPETKKVTKLSAEGNVKISRANTVTYCEKARYDTQDGRMILRGSPRVVLRDTQTDGLAIE
ncbi:MAG: LPS export ABC transporter periplasmic protein LptC [Candidatus Omnitrophica bacterium]|nr:LPS export ABC transporter periplasmic protein LptC [Candidatus Omnitrophota bacterium]